MGRPVWIRRFSAVHKSADNSQALSSIQDRLSDFVRPEIPARADTSAFPWLSPDESPGPSCIQGCPGTFSQRALRTE